MCKRGTPLGKGGPKSAHLPEAQHLPQMLLLFLRARARANTPAPQSPLSRRSRRLIWGLEVSAEARARAPWNREGPEGPGPSQG